MSWRLTPAGLGDVTTISSVVERAFDPRFGEGWSAAQLRSTMGLTGSWARLIYRDLDPLGFNLCRRAGPEAELLLVGVIPAYRGQGIGAALVQAALEAASELNIEAMFLEVRDGNQAAQQLYERAGFVAVGRRRGYYRGRNAETFDAITMRRQLKSPNSQN